MFAQACLSQYFGLLRPSVFARVSHIFMPLPDEGRAKYVWFLKVIFLLQLCLGITQLICGGLAVRYTRGQTDTFGPPYYTGAFIVGSLVSYLSTLQFSNLLVATLQPFIL